MKKFVESISAIKETAAAEIAASVDNTEVSNDDPYLQMLRLVYRWYT